MAKRARIPGTVSEIDTFRIARQVPDPILSEEMPPVADWGRKTREIGMRMRSMVQRDPKSVGLAAPQIGVRLQMLAWKDEVGNIQVLCNPEIVHRSEEMDVLDEACFSLRDKVVLGVARHHSIVVEATDLSGGPVRLALHGFPARILQHEIDHLHGKTILHHGATMPTEEWEKRRAG